MAAPSDAHEASGSGADSVDLVRFESRHAAEHMVASLGRDFRKKARKSKTTAFVATHNRDGSFKLVQSRVLTGTGLAATATHVTASVMVGFFGSIATLKGAKAMTHAAPATIARRMGRSATRRVARSPRPEGSLRAVPLHGRRHRAGCRQTGGSACRRQLALLTSRVPGAARPVGRRLRLDTPCGCRASHQAEEALEAQRR